MHKLSLANISCSIGNGCACNSSNATTYSYTVPKRIDQILANMLDIFGSSKLTLEKHSMFKIENRNYSISGINRKYNITLIIKKPEFNKIIDQFENILIEWVERK